MLYSGMRRGWMGLIVMSASRYEDLHRRAVELIQAAYDAADGMRSVDLAAINTVRPPTLRYHTQHELVRAFIDQASGMLELAGRLGLIGSEEEVEILRSHPELFHWLEDEDKRLLGES
jgi:hypothetical protein